jgi:hypothetical protein
LFIDDNNNILTTAFKLGDDNLRSDWRSLFVLNEKKNCSTSMCLDGVEVRSDKLMIDNKV